MLYQFNNKKYGRDFDTFSKIFRETSLAVAKLCKYYWDGGEHWYWPSAKVTKIKNNTEFLKFIKQKLDELFVLLKKNPELPFVFFMDKDRPDVLQKKRTVCKFDHHDKADSWVLNLSEEEFAQVQQELSKNGLPDDLFIR